MIDCQQSLDLLCKLTNSKCYTKLDSFIIFLVGFVLLQGQLLSWPENNQPNSSFFWWGNVHIFSFLFCIAKNEKEKTFFHSINRPHHLPSCSVTVVSAYIFDLP